MLATLGNQHAIRMPHIVIRGLLRSALFFHITSKWDDFQKKNVINPYPTAFPYGNGMVLHFYQQQGSSTTKTVQKVTNKGLKTYV